MNLTRDPWIPVLRRDGTTREVSLKTAFADSEHILDLSVNPPQRVAVTRLLLCVAHASLDGPEDDRAWRQCRDRLPKAACDYLDRQADRFELYADGDGWAFLQVPNLEWKGNAVVDKLDFGLASGNNPTFFDHEAGPSGRPLPHAQRAINLLTYQCFSPGGLIGSVRWAGRTTSRSSEHAACIEGSMLHTFLRGGNLLDTIHLNLLTKAVIASLPNLNWGRPVWEDPPEGPSDPRGPSSARTHLGRLVPVTRAIKLDPDSPRITLANGVAYPKFPDIREPFATVVTSKDGKRQGYLGIDLSKHPWRELNSVLASRRSGMDGGPLVLQQVARMGQQDAFDIWTGGLAANQAKILDVAEWSFHVQREMFSDVALKKYEEGVALANRGAMALARAIVTYFNDLGVSAFATNEAGKFTRNDNRTRDERRRVLQKASAWYWGRLDTEYEALIRACEVAERSLSATWYPLVWRAMTKAFEMNCPHETPRQIRAFARAQDALRLKKPGDDTGASD